MNTPFYAVQAEPGNYDIDRLREGVSEIGGAYIHRMHPDTPHILVCHPKRTQQASAWLKANGWTPLPHIHDIASTLGDLHTHPGLQSHASAIQPTDNTATAMRKVADATGLRCFDPFR